MSCLKLPGLIENMDGKKKLDKTCFSRIWLNNQVKVNTKFILLLFDRPV